MPSTLSMRTRPTWSFLAKTFLLFGGLFALILVLLVLFLGTALPIVDLLGQALLYGVLMTAFMGGGHVLASRARGAHAPLVPAQEAKVAIDGSEADAVALIRNALHGIPASETSFVRESERSILTARVPISWWSWGEIMRFTFISTNARSTEVHISSKPRLRVTWVDWGKGLTNVRRVLGAAEHAERHRAS